MSDEAYRRWVHINLPHARTIVQRIARSLEALGAFGEAANGGAFGIRDAYVELETELSGFDDDPPLLEALAAADAAAAHARTLVEAIVASTVRGDRLGQNVRNLFECLGLEQEGAELSLRCGERPDSPLR